MKTPDSNKPTLDARGLDGNIFAVLSAACKVLKKAGQPENAMKLQEQILTSKGGYHDALGMIQDYVKFIWGEDEDPVIGGFVAVYKCGGCEKQFIILNADFEDDTDPSDFTECPICGEEITEACMRRMELLPAGSKSLSLNGGGTSNGK